MSPPNRNTAWGGILLEELAAAGLDGVCVTPGSRSTPLTVAAHDHDDLRVFDHLDERSSAYFALGRAKLTGDPVGLICTSGTATANYHPAVVEASNARVPLVLLTADRPPELRDSGANQTIDQTKLYGDAVRWFRELPEPELTDRKLQRLRVDAARAVATATDEPAGPVHLNVPFSKPLEPTEVPEDDFDAPEGLGATGRDGPFVERSAGPRAPAKSTVDRIAERIADADRTLVVAGPQNPPAAAPGAIRSLAAAMGAPLLADPLSQARFSVSRTERPGQPLVCGGYDAYVGSDPVTAWPDPDAVVRFGASPTSKPLRKYLAGTDAHQIIVDPAGGWREAEFAARELVTADSGRFSTALVDALEQTRFDTDDGARQAYRDRFAAAERAHWSIVERARNEESFEGAVVPAVLEALPESAMVFASNSMPVRDLDRFARPDDRAITALANRGASGIDGIVSSVLGAASATDDPLVAIVGDLAYYHDMNGLVAAQRCGVDATIVLVNNDGGGIFHALPIEQFDPPFTQAFKTPHGLDFEPTGDLYELSYQQVDDVAALTEACRGAIGNEGLDVVEIDFEAERSHRTREELAAALSEELE